MLVLLLLVRVERGRGRSRVEVVEGEVGLVGGAMICLGMFGSESTYWIMLGVWLGMRGLT